MKSIPLHECANDDQFKRQIEIFKAYLVGMQDIKGLRGMSNADLLNVRDEILADMNQLMYLLTFK
jgi:hypothetical protein